MAVDPIELLGRLEDDLRRAQDVTGVASRERGEDGEWSSAMLATRVAETMSKVPARPLEHLRRKASDRRATHRKQRDAEREALWPEIERIVRTQEAEFVSDRSVRRLREGLEGLGEGSQIDVFRVLHHGLEEAFESARLAVARFVEHVQTRDQGLIRLNRQAGGVCVIVDRRVERAEILAFVEQLRRRDRRLLICAEMIGVLLGITAAWRPGMGPGTVIRSMVGSVPRIIELGRELADLD